MSTTIVSTWAGTDLSSLGPVYPFVGTETMWWIAGLAFWLGFQFLQMGRECSEYSQEIENLKSNNIDLKAKIES